MPSPILKGLTTLFWGTKALMPAMGSGKVAIVESIKYTPHNFVGVVEDGDGFEFANALLVDGFDADVSFVSDSALTLPAEGDTVALKSPRFSTAKDCLLVEIGEDVNRKKEAMTTFKLSWRPNRSLT